MNKSIKYIIEKTINFNPVDYSDDGNNIIDNQVVHNMTDPILQFIGYIGQINWEYEKFGNSFDLLYINDDVNKIQTDIFNELKSMNEIYKSSDEKMATITINYVQTIYSQGYILSISTNEHCIEFYYYIDNPGKTDSLEILKMAYIDQSCMFNKYIGKIPERFINLIKDKYKFK